MKASTTSFPKKHILWKEKKLQPKKLFKVRKNNMTEKDNRPLLLLY